MLDAPAEIAFDRLTRLAARVLGTPVAFISLIDSDRQFFMSSVGLPARWAAQRETPLSHSFCQYTLLLREPLVVSDARTHPWLRENLAIRDLDVIAYAGIPLITPEGHVLGALCAVDSQPRLWRPEDVATLQDLAAAALTEVTLREELAQRRVVMQEREWMIGQLQDALARMQALYHTAHALIRPGSLLDLLQAAVDGTAEALPADRVSLITVDHAAQAVTQRVAGGPGAPRIVPVTLAELLEGLTGWVLQTRQAALSPKGAPDLRESPAVQRRRAATASGAVMVVPLVYQDDVLGTLTAINRPEERDFTEQDLELLEAIANQATIAITNAQLFAEVQRLAVTDGLTGVYNRRGFSLLGGPIVERSRRSRRPLGLLLIDLDLFKQVNDTYGHATGDEMLCHVAACCSTNIRQMDLLGRWGGEEFVVLLPDTAVAEAQEIAERLRAAVAATPLATARGPLAVTISIGLASGIPVDLPGLIDQADAAMYSAKAGGRNRVASG